MQATPVPATPKGRLTQRWLALHQPEPRGGSRLRSAAAALCCPLLHPSLPSRISKYPSPGRGRQPPSWLQRRPPSCSQSSQSACARLPGRTSSWLEQVRVTSKYCSHPLIAVQHYATPRYMVHPSACSIVQTAPVLRGALEASQCLCIASSHLWYTCLGGCSLRCCGSCTIRYSIVSHARCQESSRAPDSLTHARAKLIIQCTSADVSIDGEPPKRASRFASPPSTAPERPQRATRSASPPQRPSRRCVKAKRVGTATATSPATDMETDLGSTDAPAASPAADARALPQHIASKRLRKADGSYEKVAETGARASSRLPLLSAALCNVHPSLQLHSAAHHWCVELLTPCLLLYTLRGVHSALTHKAELRLQQLQPLHHAMSIAFTCCMRPLRVPNDTIQTRAKLRCCANPAEVDLDSDRRKRTTRSASKTSAAERPNRRCVKARRGGAASATTSVTASAIETDEGSSDAAAAAIPAADVSAVPQAASSQRLRKAEGATTELPGAGARDSSRLPSHSTALCKIAMHLSASL